MWSLLIGIREEEEKGLLAFQPLKKFTKLVSHTRRMLSTLAGCKGISSYFWGLGQ